MANNYFQFKQFKIEQEYCAMKVCTDACLFGAWVVELLKQQDYSNQIELLDIGTGTGLLSLMTAQAIDCKIEALEIDAQAAAQAIQNFADSSFTNKINITEADFKQWHSEKHYDCIISNPPFFENDLASPDAKKNLALHSSALTLKELIEIASNKIHANGIIALLIPYHRKDEMIQLATATGLHLFANADIKQTPKHNYFRSFLAFSPKAKTLHPEEIIIQDNRVYTDRFKALLKDYYLAF